MSFNDATTYSSTSSSLRQPTKPYNTRETCPSTMPPRTAPRASFRQPMKLYHTRATCSSAIPPRTAPRALLYTTPRTSETVSHEGNMYINDATAYSSTSSSLRQPTKLYHTRVTCPSTMPPRTAPRALLSANQPNCITRGKHVLRRCHRVKLHQLFSPPTNETVSHEGNM